MAPRLESKNGLVINWKSKASAGQGVGGVGCGGGVLLGTEDVELNLECKLDVQWEGI